MKIHKRGQCCWTCIQGADYRTTYRWWWRMNVGLHAHGTHAGSRCHADAVNIHCDVYNNSRLRQLQRQWLRDIRWHLSTLPKANSCNTRWQVWQRWHCVSTSTCILSPFNGKWSYFQYLSDRSWRIGLVTFQSTAFYWTIKYKVQGQMYKTDIISET